jgi:NAD(P)-dependent dehydrogenase (short-subunit alcohol dehydrogenase family)
LTQLLQGKTAIVTGASSGIGKVTALELAKAGVTVVMVCRPGSKAEAARDEIAVSAGRNQVELITADLSDQASVRACAQDFKNRHARLDILVNNAGIFLSDRQVTVDGLERTFATNHLAYFLLTALLLDTLKASAPARIVSVASEAQRWGKIDFNDLQGNKTYSGIKAYAQSKLANILFTYELARKTMGTGVTANCLHPGVVRTGWGHGGKGLFKLGMKLFGFFMSTPEQGAKTSIYLASSPEVEGITGRYFIKCKPVESNITSYDFTIAEKLWEISKELTSLSEH